MSLKIVYPVPLESEDVISEFAPSIRRWCDSYRQFPPGCEMEIVAVCIGADPPDSIRECFEGLPVSFLRYNGSGCDGGSVQFAMATLGSGFAIGCNTRVYFHRKDWGHRMSIARLLHGPGFYSSSASTEIRTHLCFRFYGVEIDDFLRAIPEPIIAREGGLFTEVGDEKSGNLTEWFERQGKAAKVVYWDGVYDRSNWFTPDNRFRNGDQSNMLAFDRHTDIYRDADPDEKKKLEQFSSPVI